MGFQILNTPAEVWLVILNSMLIIKYECICIIVEDLTNFSKLMLTRRICVQHIISILLETTQKIENNIKYVDTIFKGD